MKTLFTNIKKLIQVENKPRQWVAGNEMKKLPCIDDAFLLIEKDKIAAFGTMDKLTKLPGIETYKNIDVSGQMVLPAFCDSHTHLVYAGSRELEFVDKIKGLSYQEIAQRGGGILNSAKLLAETSEDDLFESAWERLNEISRFGTGAVEIKSGYGLNTQNELKMLRVIRRLKQESPLTIRSTFLAAHAIPVEYKTHPDKYVDLIISEMLPQVAAEELADYIDVFCDKGFFSLNHTERILMAGIKFGLRAKIHANELGFTGGVQVGVKYNALSVDHLEYMGDEEIACLKNSETMPTILPGSAFFLNMPLSPARKMMEAGLPVAFASDYNPGSSPSGNMKFVMSLGCINYKMLSEEVINAVTINSAYAMGLHETHGSVCVGKQANLIITRPIDNYEFLPYAYTSDLIEKVMLNGKFIN